MSSPTALAQVQVLLSIHTNVQFNKGMEAKEDTVWKGGKVVTFQVPARTDKQSSLIADHKI